MAGLCALTKLYLDHFDLRVGGGYGKFFFGETAIFVARPEIARRHLIDQITTTFAVITRNAAFAGIMGKAALFGPFVQRQDRVAGKCTEAHGRDIIQAAIIGLLAMRAANAHPKIGIGDVLGRDGMGDP